jgi:SagB-type dehydrogenase family enzyme
MFKKRKLIFTLIILIIIVSSIVVYDRFLNGQTNNKEDPIKLTQIKQDKKLNKLLYNRQSVRNYNKNPLQFDSFSNIIWSAEGINVDGVSGPTRTSPSAGATNPLTIYAAVSNVEELESGLYKYNIRDHTLLPQLNHDINSELAQAALGQAPVREAALVVIISADYENTTNRYGQRGIKYVHMEAGMAAQNVLLTAQQYGLGAVVIGAFENNKIKEVMGEILETPLLIIPIGNTN